MNYIFLLSEQCEFRGWASGSPACIQTSMKNDQFPVHFDAQEVNLKGKAPATLPIEVKYGKAKYRVDMDGVHISNKTENNEEVNWSEPLSAYRTVSHWIVGEIPEESKGLLKWLFGRKKTASGNASRHSVIALLHGNEPWMSVVLHCRPLAEGEVPEGVDVLVMAYRRLLNLET